MVDKYVNDCEICCWFGVLYFGEFVDCVCLWWVGYCVCMLMMCMLFYFFINYSFVCWLRVSKGYDFIFLYHCQCVRAVFRRFGIDCMVFFEVVQYVDEWCACIWWGW